jgi:protein phosphatase inhibitor 2
MTVHSPHAADGSPPKRPRGILKNRSTSNANAISPPPPAAPVLPTTDDDQRPGVGRELSEREVVLANTLRNAGPKRRSSSNPGGGPSRRASGHGTKNGDDAADENSPRLKWDEANLYLNEQDMGDKMKITEPKTPYAKQYDPTEDEENAVLNPDDLLVDEVDKKYADSGEVAATRTNRVKDDEIPDLDIGDAEMVDANPPTPESEKRVMVDTDMEDEGHHGEAELMNMSEEERQKHKRFEQMRKKHYEMKDIKGLLGYVSPLSKDKDGTDMF